MGGRFARSVLILRVNSPALEGVEFLLELEDGAGEQFGRVADQEPTSFAYDMLRERWNRTQMDTGSQHRLCLMAKWIVSFWAKSDADTSEQKAYLLVQVVLAIGEQLDEREVRRVDWQHLTTKFFKELKTL